MSNNDKKFSAREAAQAVLAKAYQVLAKSETLKKYETANSPKAGVKYGKIETAQKPMERDYSEYEVKPGSSLDSAGPRLKRQISPSMNPKEEAEGNNKPDGMEPRYEFKDKVAKELAKEKAAHMDKGEKLAKGDWAKIHSKLKREGYSEESADKIDGAIKAKMGKAENPDKEADAKLGEKVEHDVEDHFKENKEAEAKEGHKLMVKPDEKMPMKSEESEGEKTFVPAALVGSAKLAKFMERKHAKRKAAQGSESQAPAAVGEPASDAPAARSPEGQPKASSAPNKKMLG